MSKSFPITRVAFAVFAVIAAISAPVSAPAVTADVALNQGGEIRGELLRENPDKVVVDLGFTLLAIPRSAIATVRTVIPAARETVFNTDLFRESSSAGASGVRELAGKVGSAVVQVNSSLGLGSGFIIHPDGYIITNDHVIAADTKLSVTLFKGEGKDMQKRRYDNVRIVATDGHLDLALLKIENTRGEKFPTVPLGFSETLAQGSPVFAVGSPLGLERTVSSGIVSLRNRNTGTRLLVQTTTQINPGNSGGPLFNMNGEVVGVNNLKIVIIGFEGLGFAIPVDVVKDFLRNRDAYAFDPANPNNGFLYHAPPSAKPVKARAK
ncbi:MAG: trypsin-like peptidase domain-containing protein [Puniceicoccales bacterium]|jgi:serine protease Do|nr:trypsin-like peptidase domain-containing protein [Puniceicoccales bacterium]